MRLVRAGRMPARSTGSASITSTDSPIPKPISSGCRRRSDEVRPFYLLIEKILGPGEELRADWPVAGTTGYEFIRALADLFTDPRGESGMTRAYCDFLQEEVDYEALILDAKRMMLIRNLAGELEHLKDMAGALALRQLATRDFGNDTLRRAIIELAAALPVYRTYVDVSGAQDEDRAILAAAAEQGESGASSRRRGGDRFPEARAGARSRVARGSGVGARICRAVSADDRPDHGQGARGHRLLPLQPADRAQ